MTMTESLIKLLKRRYVTPLDALQHCGCLSLSQRVGGLIRSGVNVAKKPVVLENGKRVMSYRIVGGK